MSLHSWPEALKRIFATAELPELGPGKRSGVLTVPEVNKAIRLAMANEKSSGTTTELVRCVALLWHDHLDAAHEIAQGIENRDGSWLHGIMHRREPDYGNAKYWFRRAGAHPAFAELALRAKPLLDRVSANHLSARLMRSGTWNPLVFVDSVEAALGPGGSKQEQDCLRRLQAVELETALETFRSQTQSARQ